MRIIVCNAPPTLAIINANWSRWGIVLALFEVINHCYVGLTCPKMTPCCLVAAGKKNPKQEMRPPAWLTWQIDRMRYWRKTVCFHAFFWTLRANACTAVCPLRSTAGPPRGVQMMLFVPLFYNNGACALFYYLFAIECGWVMWRLGGGVARNQHGGVLSARARPRLRVPDNHWLWWSRRPSLHKKHKSFDLSPK